MNTVLPSSLSCTLDTQRRNEFWATLALRHCQGLGARTACTLLKQFGSACAVLQALKRPARCASLLADAAFDTNARPQGRAVSCVHDAGSVNRATGMVQQRAPLAPEHGRGISRKVADALSRDDWRISARKEWDKALSLRGVQVLLWTDSDYPALLRELPDAPALLYARGDLSLLRAPAVGVVGTRRSTERGRRDATTLAGNLAAAGICIVSGMARGIDRAAHKAALPLPGGTIAVLGTGIDVIYPAGNADLYAELCANALVLSEFAPGTRPEAYNFPQPDHQRSCAGRAGH